MIIEIIIIELIKKKYILLNLGEHVYICKNMYVRVCM